MESLDSKPLALRNSHGLSTHHALKDEDEREGESRKKGEEAADESRHFCLSGSILDQLRS